MNSMKIEIGNYRIQRADDLNIIIEEYRKPSLSKNPDIAAKQSHEKKWQLRGHYGNVEQALNKLVDLSLSEEEIQSVNELIEKIAELKLFVRDAFSPNT